MRLKDLLVEKFDKNRNVIVVDIQPAYESGWDNPRQLYEVMDFLNSQNQILMLVNADSDGFTDDTKDSVYEYWLEHDFDEEKFSDVTYFDKGYGFLRSWMDNGVSEHTIIRVIREMYRNRVWDSRELFGGEDSDEYETLFEEFVGHEFQDWMLSDPLIVEYVPLKLLKKFEGSYIIGGGRNECLREVELIMNAFNIKYKRIDKFVY